MSKPYDLHDKTSILNFAKKLQGKTLRDVLNPVRISGIENKLISAGNKGRFGQLVENHYFEYESNSDSAPDFPCGLELKVTPFKILKNGLLSPKERMVCNIINFMTVVDENWENSTFLGKNVESLLIRYVDPMDASISQLDYKFLDVRVHNLHDSGDIEQFEKDWNVIVNKIKSGKAHQISEGDTKFLGACTKGATSKSVREQPFSNEMAMQRAFCFKTQYMRILLNRAPEIYNFLK
jgi:DNA mismatch repair protein MutH